mmetsp:Transcript_10452/g.20595  ORF Transcript_10452/g.20595 Transcript_10452/m.20595 type:complete len:389 (+) Transcript_10452:157-1323(+)|eukprot:CAMPEP_0171496360 /NCGR_PEP_ID=MMETSP0958-20121227/6661_1 /TAXON_ID=87120 /ORGANISM="Aurantiochytrium limacinum, Strain ATCCMYA-1381" /LENGTH=388 /DNA_ID=CAMNT_0012030459 /DNA_START=153 /DNA_END=1319 /DNA_ORIENTATION=+
MPAKTTRSAKKAGKKVSKPVVEEVIEESEIVEEELPEDDVEESESDAEMDGQEDDEDDEEEAGQNGVSQFEDSSDDGEDDDEDDEDDSDDEEVEGEPGTSTSRRGGLAVAANSFTADLGHVAAFNTTPLDPSKVSSNAYLREMALQNVNLLFRDLMNLPGVEGSKVLKELPAPQFKLPRHKPLPKPKPETRWEKYARDQGIEKRKRDRMIWDEAKQEWAPRWGYKRGNDDQHDWLIEVKDSENPDTDKFAERRNAKKLRVLKNRKNYLRNRSEAGDASAVHAVENLNVKGARGGASKRGKDKVMSRLQTAQVSTASLGRFDAAMEGEPTRQLKTSKKRKFDPSEKTNDHDRDKQILSKLLGKHIGGSSEKAAPARKKPAKGKAKKAKK